MPRKCGLDLTKEFLPCQRGYNYLLGWKERWGDDAKKQRRVRNQVVDTPSSIDGRMEVADMSYESISDVYQGRLFDV
jgi:hypothetical protein